MKIARVKRNRARKNMSEGSKLKEGKIAERGEREKKENGEE